MSTAADTPAEADPERVAAALSGAGFVRVYARPTGDALAAAGLVARALAARNTAFQVRTTRDAGVPDGDGTPLALGWTAPNATAIPSGDRPVSAVAAAAVDALGAEPDPLVGLAGVVAAGAAPGDAGSGSLLEEAERRGVVERRPGVAVPTADLADGLAHSTLFRAPYSGGVAGTRALLDDLGVGDGPDDDAHRRVASAVALDATDGAPERAVAAVERALRPHATPTGPFATLGGQADVFDVLARTGPGLGVSLALGAGVADAALDAWRDHGAAVHRVLADPTTGRYDGVFVARVETDPADASTLPAAARVVRDFASPEPLALVVSDDAAAAAGDGGADATAALRAGVAATDSDADVVGDARGGDARFTGGDVQAFIGGFREALG
ncbi:exonuclease RecJ [Halobaculum litoreum]|uniref:Exonuclease RecJ n=1 Tax=Halobaculum litoreum TaxID=3031998 RepID=A0ABD5XSJ5_9EURY|nr:exonuclease RecJ [Halobaculum sp. DT92]